MMVTGLIILENPIAISAVILIFFGVFGKKEICNILSLCGSVILIFNEIIYSLFWYVMTRKEPFNFSNSISYAKSGFYIGLIISFKFL
ncbi:MAG: hypothetical protein LIO62_02340 [Clostridiales bacterium]|nr:hypothetical protein [Clostridiales bacterium]